MKNDQIIKDYAISVQPLKAEDGGGFQALFPQIARTLVGYGSSQEEAVEDLLGAVPTLLQLMETKGQSLPAPEGAKEWDEFSGKFNVRVMKMLHAKLVRLAEAQGISLNSLVQTLLMSGATALEAGHEFGAVVDTEPESEVLPRYDWGIKPHTSSPALRIEDYSALRNERNPDEWKVAVGA